MHDSELIVVSSHWLWFPDLSVLSKKPTIPNFVGVPILRDEANSTSWLRHSLLTLQYKLRTEKRH